LPLHQVIFLVLWATACCYAAVRGGAPERIMAGAIFIALVATWVFASRAAPAVSSYRSIILGVALTDIALFAVMMVVALISTRFWPIIMASMQGCGMLGHISKPLGPDIMPAAYYATVAFWGFPIVILLAVGTWRHRVRLKRYGVDYAWVRNLPHRYRQGWSIDELTRPLPQR
jgi:hypothetical protein